MKFSQKLVCIMLLVIAAFFAVGGAVLVNGSFMDRLSAAAEQEQSMHAMLCGVVEDYYLDQTGRGEDTCGDDFITAATWRAGDLARGVYSQGLFRASADPTQDEAYAIYGLQDGQSILQYGPHVTRTYRSDLLGGLVMVTTFDVTEIFAARNRSLQRFFLLEAAVVAGAAVVVWLVSRRLTHPLTVLTAASARIAAGDYALRTRMHTGDELEILSQGFDQMAGAVQDNDRGSIVGRRTFGKGLVQRPFDLPDGSMIRLTVAHYYTPSGRCIQKPYTKGNKKDYDRDVINRLNHGELTCIDSIHLDSTKTYYTLNEHRVVYGGGGIMPDIFVPLDTTKVSPMYSAINRNNLILDPMLKYADQNRKSIKRKYKQFDAYIASFEVPQALIDEILEKAKEKGIKPKDDADLAGTIADLRRVLKSLIANNIWDRNEYFRLVNMESDIVNRALDFLNKK